MDWQSVVSSNISELAHDPETNTLGVKFKNGGTYYYQGVDATKYNALLKADSIGKHLHEHIKGKHEFSKE
jgi:hypothetical protein